MIQQTGDAEGYRALRETVGAYANPGKVYRMDGPGAAGLLALMAARSTDFLAPGSMLDSLVLDADGSVRGLITIIWDEEVVLVMADASVGLDQLAQSIAADNGIDDVEVVDVTDVWRIVWMEGPTSWRVAQTYYPGDIAQLMLSTVEMLDEPLAGGRALIGRHGTTGEYGSFIAVENPQVDLMEMLAPQIAECGGAFIGAGALARAQVEVHHPQLPQQAAGASVREASLTWLMSPVREDAFVGSTGWNAEPTRGTIALVAPAGADLQVGAPVLADGQQVGTVSVVVPTCGQGTDLALGLLDIPFAVPGLELTVAGTTVSTMSCPVIQPLSWTSAIGDI